MLANAMWKALVSAYPFRRGRARLIDRARRSLSGRVLSRDCFGNRLLLDLDNLIDVLIYLEGSYEATEIRELADVASRNGCEWFVDVGANLGCYTLFFAKRPEIRRVFAFEPDPRNRAQLCANLWLNGMAERTEISAAALSSASGTATFYVNRPERAAGGPQFNTGTSSLAAAGSPHHQPVEVRTDRLDDAVPLRDQRVLVKIDVEGAETAVLEGARDFLSRNRCVVMVEVWDRGGGVEAMQNWMERLGYERLPSRRVSDNYLFASRE